MKRNLFLFAIILCSFVNKAMAQTEWPQKEKFREYLEHGYRPAIKDDIGPAKLYADSLLISATEWRAAAIPAGFNPVMLQKDLAELIKKCSEFQKAVTDDVKDKELKKMLIDVRKHYLKIISSQ